MSLQQTKELSSAVFYTEIMAFHMSSRQQMPVDASNELGPMQDCGPVPADTPTLRHADRCAIERGEDEGMAVRVA